MILIVDDNKDFSKRVIELLRDSGNTEQIMTASHYNEAVSLIAKNKPAVILLDVNMPGKSGIEVLRYIRQERWKCKVVMVTNHSNESYRKLCLEAGADHFLDKSRGFNLIPSLIQKLIT